MAEDAEFKQRVYDVVMEEVVQNFDTRQGNAKNFYEDPDDITVPVKE
jgi:hypothetical protein